VTRALAFGLLFVLTNATLLLLVPLTVGRFLVVAALYAAGTGLMLLALFHPGAEWLASSRRRVACGNRPCVALTFDDGPSPEVTPKVLAILEEKNVRATFFMIGRRVVASPDLARRIVRAGHAVGNHTHSHPALFCFLTPRRLHREIQQAQDAILQATGVRPSIFRPPVGLRHPLLRPSLEHASLELVLWRLRSYDTRKVTAHELRTRILTRVQPGAIILLHDRPGPGSSSMLASLPGVIDALSAGGFDFVTVDSADGLGRQARCPTCAERSPEP